MNNAMLNYKKGYSKAIEDVTNTLDKWWKRFNRMGDYVPKDEKKYMMGKIKELYYKTGDKNGK